MMKFFRKYNKTLLAVFMVLLMVVFMGGSALETFFQPSGNRTVATSKNGNITTLDQQIAQSTTRILSTLPYVDWQRPVPGVIEPLEIVDWILLVSEAKELGLAANPAQIRASLPSADAFDEAARRLRVKPANIIDALVELTSVRQTAMTVAGATAPSQPEVEAAARKAMEKVRINTVMLPAEVFVDSDAEVSEAELEAMYSEFREREPGPGLSFGYFLPAAVKVQYVKIDRDVLAKTVRVPNLMRKARKFYDEQRDRNPDFRRPADEEISTDDELTGPAIEKTPYLSWDEAKDKAVELIRRQEASAAASRLADWLMQYAVEPWLAVTRGDNGYKEPPAVVANLGYYASIVGKAPATIAYSDALSVGETDFITEADAGKLDGIGAAFFFSQQGGRPFGLQGSLILNLADLAFKTQAIIPKVPDAKGTNPADYLSMFQTCRIPLRDAGNGDIYVFRVVDTRAAHAAKSLDEVRDMVVRDVRTKRGYVEALARAESLRSCEEYGSLEEAYNSDEDLVYRVMERAVTGSGYLEPPAFARMIRYFATGGGISPPTRIGDGVGSIPPEATEKLFKLNGAGETVTVIELKDRSTVMVVEWVDTLPPQSDEFDSQRKTLFDELARNRRRSALTDWLNPENIRARNSFALVRN